MKPALARLGSPVAGYKRIKLWDDFLLATQMTATKMILNGEMFFLFLPEKLNKKRENDFFDAPSSY